MYYGGIDPGKDGAISVLDSKGQIVTYFTFPKIGKEIDMHILDGIFKELRKDQITFAFENVHSIFGSSAKSNFQFGWINGVLEAFLISKEFPFLKVHPKTWQKQMHEGIPKQKDIKKMSLQAAKRLFPTESFLQNSGCKVPHDGIVDATLIAEYCRRKYVK